MIRRCIPGLFAGLIAITGCLYPVAHRVSETVAEQASVPRDTQPLSHVGEPWPGARDEPEVTRPEAAKAEKAKAIPLTLPEELPGGKLPPITLPPVKAGNETARQQAIAKLYPPLPPIGKDLPYPPGPQGLPLTLADLQPSPRRTVRSFARPPPASRRCVARPFRLDCRRIRPLATKATRSTPRAEPATRVASSSKGWLPPANSVSPGPPRRWICVTRNWHSEEPRPTC